MHVERCLLASPRKFAERSVHEALMRQIAEEFNECLSAWENPAKSKDAFVAIIAYQG